MKNRSDGIVTFIFGVFCLFLIIVGLVDFYNHHRQLILNVPVAMVVAIVLGLIIVKWAKGIPEFVFVGCGFGSFIIFTVVTVTSWWIKNEFHLKLSYFSAFVAFLLLFFLLRRFSRSILRGRGDQYEEKEHNLLLALGLGALWPIAALLGFGFVYVRLRYKADSKVD